MPHPAAAVAVYKNLEPPAKMAMAKLIEPSPAPTAVIVKVVSPGDKIPDYQAEVYKRTRDTDRMADWRKKRTPEQRERANEKNRLRMAARRQKISQEQAQGGGKVETVKGKKAIMELKAMSTTELKAMGLPPDATSVI